jgi:thiol:disulfide interchange protein DsbA
VGPVQRRRLILLGAVLGAPLAARAAPAIDLLEEADYRVIPQQPTADPRRVEVVEFFYYGCRWCNQLEPYLNEWLSRKPTDVDFFRQPALRSSRWVTLTAAFYALEALGALPRLHGQVFRAYHREHLDLEDEAKLIQWAQQQGLDRDQFERALHSEAVKAKVDAARALTDRYEIDSTPSVVVDGRYLTSSGMAGGVAALMDIVEQLVLLAREDHATPK